ncbi:hypothetical protein AQUCO_05900011v1 [Aquilegia coerulea]|uniref:Uncharacterized protein n=1 Tax=Aquilegia coerulea TaxID=218851 RepID=A0A2G5CDZ4_AQUCA|nr:hypothetical protein AQUCO_05900011v1 [Aquilegia coerulea]
MVGAVVLLEVEKNTNPKNTQSRKRRRRRRSGREYEIKKKNKNKKKDSKGERNEINNNGDSKNVVENASSMFVIMEILSAYFDRRCQVLLEEYKRLLSDFLQLNTEKQTVLIKLGKELESWEEDVLSVDLSNRFVSSILKIKGDEERAFNVTRPKLKELKETCHLGYQIEMIRCIALRKILLSGKK